MSDTLQPLWFKLPKQFYRDLALIAESSDMAPEDVLKFSLDLLGELVVISQEQGVSLKEFISALRPRIRAWQKEASGHQVSLIQAVEDGAKLYHVHGPISSTKEAKAFRKVPSTLAILRWANVPPSERSEQARKLSHKRWAKKNDDSKKTAGDSK